MPKLTAAEKAERKLRMEEKREARRLAKEKKDEEKKVAEKLAPKPSAVVEQVTPDADDGAPVKKGPSFLLQLPEDALHHVMTFLPPASLGCLSMTSRALAIDLLEARVPFVLSRLNRPHQPLSQAVGRTSMCSTQAEARKIIEQSYGGGETGRIIQKGKKKNKSFVHEFVSYARFLDEAVSGYAVQNYGGREPVRLPQFVHGRFVSVSPEHSLCRVGGDGLSGAGGSGVASWGIGKRGQLGHGKRQDQDRPRMLLGGIGYGIRIVQVSAGGGLVRVAHSLLLTSTGRVLSFGTGQYGALGHGFSGGKQLPDGLRPRYIDALAGVRCVCVSAGELHSAVVTADGDLYTWGDGFCGQLGHADKRPQTTPVQVVKGGLEDECIASVSCGARHTLAVTEDGEVFSFGLGHFGVLGRAFTPYDHDPDAAVMALGGPPGEEEGMVLPGLALPPPALNQAQQQLPNADQLDAAENNRDIAADLIAHLDMLANLSLTDSSDQCIPKVIDSLAGIKIVGASAGHRHTLLLDSQGSLYSCGAGISGCLGHGNHLSSMVPLRIGYFDDDNIRIMQMSAGVDMSMAVTTTGDVFSWGKTDKGRIGLGLQNGKATLPKRVRVCTDGGEPVKAVDVDCGYVHSMVVGLNGTIHLCGSVGIDGALDGETSFGEPTQIDDFNIWHRIPEPKEVTKTERWKKYGKYEVKGRHKMMTETFDHALK